MWIADLERRLCNFLGIVPDDDDIAAVTAVVTSPAMSPAMSAADLDAGEQQPSPIVPASAPCGPEAQEPPQVRLRTRRVPASVRAGIADAAFDAELGALRRTVRELRDGLVGNV